MKLLARAARPGDVARCAELATDRFLYDARSLAALKTLWLDVIRYDAGCSCVVYAEDSPRDVLAFAISACVPPCLIDELRAGCAPFVVRRLVERQVTAGDLILAEAAVAEANAGDGVDVLVLSNGMIETENRADAMRLYVELTHQVVARHANLNLRSFAHELFGWFPDYVEDLGFNVRSVYPSYERELAQTPADKRPLVAWVTRDDAARRPSLLVNQMFLRFSPPRLGLRTMQRRLIRLAVEGESDETAGDVLCVSDATVKKWWLDIYDAVRQSDIVPVSVTRRARGAIGNGCRGTEMRRHVLAFVREHPEELHPYVAARPARFGARTTFGGDA